MIKNKGKGNLIVISGPSGSGKDSIVNLILNDEVKLSISATTRNKRKDEVEGVHYYFLTKKEFEDKINNGDFLEFAQVHQTDYYGTLKSEVEKDLHSGKDVLLVIDVIGALQIKEKFPDVVFIFILPPSVQVLKERLIKRETETMDTMIKRFNSLYKEITKINEYNYVVVNDDLKLAAKEVKSIITSERCKIESMGDLIIDTDEDRILQEIIDFYSV